MKTSHRRQTVLQLIDRQIRAIEEECHVRFTPHNGWAQVDGKGEALNRAYGAWNALMALSEAINDS